VPRPAITTIYIHGAGRQNRAAVVKERLDAALFGPKADSRSTRLAYYANVCWPFTERGELAPDARDRNEARRAVSETIGYLAKPRLPPDRAADRLLEAVDRTPGPPGRRRRPARTPTSPARQLLEGLFARADDLARQHPRVARGGLELTLPDPIFRRLAGQAGIDVVRYLYEGWAPAMRVPVRDAIAATSGPLVIVAHSLGTILAYDILSEVGMAERDVRLLVTVGSPLGIGNVRVRLRDRRGPGRIPPSIRQWWNFADPNDLVPMLGYTLRDKFDPRDWIHEPAAVNNRASNNHAFTGYLSIGRVRTTVRDALAGAD
jgi:hypothetical protein